MKRSLQKTISEIPTNPGIYIFKNKQGMILYIGKAKNLKNRVRSYFRQSNTMAPDKTFMVHEIASLDYTIVDSELEALLLETTLIKKHRPPFNIRMTDDKYWQYIKILVDEDFPRVYSVRQILDDGAMYFGPYTSGYAVRDTLQLLRRIFLFRDCKLDITQRNIHEKIQNKFIKNNRPCLDFHIKKCVAPCAGYIPKAEYHETIKKITEFLQGKHKHILTNLEVQMSKASKKHQYERAARLRDQISHIHKITEKQKVISTRMKNQDIICFVKKGKIVAINLFIIRSGTLLDKKNFLMKGQEIPSNGNITQACIKQYYSKTIDFPDEILIHENIAEKELLEKWLNKKRKEQSLRFSRKKIRIILPRIGDMKKLVTIGIANANEFLKQRESDSKLEKERTTDALKQLGKHISLAVTPSRIECYDISNISGIHAVGSMVVFKNGKPAKKDYRKFSIKTVIGANDVAMMREVLERRFHRLRHNISGDTNHNTNRDKNVHAQDASFDEVPHLVILDGGKGQLHAIVQLFDEKKITIPLISLAKKHEEIFLPHKNKPVILPHRSNELYLIQRIRDEAHRFAISYFRTKQAKSLNRSLLEDVPSVGPTTRKKLLRTFGSVDVIRAATEHELSKVLSKNQIKNIKEFL